MVFITEKLIRKRSEHNELIIGTLEELSLHQEDIERIEHIGNWCKDLKILLLQSNLISKIENLQKLKKLQYLNLAINNIERIENLEPLESLHKLDLTLNFIGELSSVESLRNNHSLRELFLTGNPCTDYPGYRDYVMCALPQLDSLDGQEITITDRLKASRHFKQIRDNIVQLELKHKIERDEQKVRVAEMILEQEQNVTDLDDEERAKQFWQQKSEHCPEMRIMMAKYSDRTKQNPARNFSDPGEPKKRTILFAACGRPYSLNEPKIKFDFHDEEDRYELNLHVYRFLDTSLIEVDAQPNYVRATIKGKVFQLALRHEIKTDASTCKRSTITGHLLIVMPKLNPENVCFDQSKSQTKECSRGKTSEKTELKGVVDYRNIVSDGKTGNNSQIQTDDDVPPLI
ncbi:protein tilB isoform X2 [Toxorhynchites rutilus septentrionalis]|uniref:protein tilB isoform X2 n=1 Tax=Toxorhynchites rutilus septentrionalis TaxID=329112 RepID=UPI0024783EA1|nr:protein tilB isoform X2 [Toxorhynchites rutilus septentrionalis]